MNWKQRVYNWLDYPTHLGTVIVALVVLVLLVLTLAIANAKTTGEVKYPGADDSDYYAHLMMPDHPSEGCCGEGDVYFADNTEFGPKGELYAVITDTRPDHRVLPDGRVIDRAHVPVGTRVLVPSEKIRKHYTANPTGHTIIFLSQSGDMYVWCYEPQALL